MPAILPRPSSSAITSVPARSLATGTCRPAPPRHTCATTPPWLTGTRPACRSRLISATTSRSPRSTATNAPASSTSNSSSPMLPGLAAHYHRAIPCPACRLAYLLLGDLATRGLERRHELIHRAQPLVIGRLQPQRVIHPRADALGPPLVYRIVRHRQQVCVNRRRETLLTAHTDMLQRYH